MSSTSYDTPQTQSPKCLWYVDGGKLLYLHAVEIVVGRGVPAPHCHCERVQTANP